MDSKLDKLILASEANFNTWINRLNEHLHRLSKERMIIDRKPDEQIFRIADALCSISELFIKYGNFKDTFKTGDFILHYYGPELDILSEKTGINLDFGIDQKGLYLSSRLSYIENLPYMDDGFYKDFLSLSEFGDFSIFENQGYNNPLARENEQLFVTQKSQMFKMLRYFFVGYLGNERDIVSGILQIYWKHGTDFEEIVRNGCQAFKVLYRLNYALWKVTDLRKKKAGK